MSITLAELMGKAPLSFQTLTVVNKIDGSTDTANTYTIAAVNPSTSVLFVLGAGGHYQYTEGLSIYAANAHAYLASATQVVAPSNRSGQQRTSSVSVVDFGRLVKSVQRGVVAVPHSSAALATVNPAKCLALVNFDNNGPISATAAVTASALNLSLSGTNGYSKAYWQVVEFY